MIAAVLRAAVGDDAVLATTGNLNNDIGVPLMLLRLRDGHRYAVIEMGMNHLDEISYLTRLAEPGVALVTNAGVAHIGELGSREAIARAKSEIYEGLDEAGIALINADDDFAELWRDMNRGRKVIDFGIDQPAAVSAQYELSPAGSLVSVRTPDAEYVTRLQVPGLHNVRNALAAAAVAYALDITPDKAAAGLASYGGTKGRLQRKTALRGAILIDDTYNANPDSVTSRDRSAGRRTRKTGPGPGRHGRAGRRKAPQCTQRWASRRGVPTSITCSRWANCPKRRRKVSVPGASIFASSTLCAPRSTN